MFQAQYRSNSQFWKNLLKTAKAYSWDRGSLTDVPSFKIKPKSRCESSHPCKIAFFCTYIPRYFTKKLNMSLYQKSIPLYLEMSLPVMYCWIPDNGFQSSENNLMQKDLKLLNSFKEEAREFYFLRILFLGILKIYVICLIQCSMLKNNPYSHDYTILMETI